MLRIGDFSALSQVPIKTLRYWDEYGLLRPARVDPDTGYRYYAAHQLAQLHRILALKGLGFSLEEVARVLDATVTAAELRGMLRLRQAEQRERADAEAERLARVEARLRLIEQEGSMGGYEVVLKTVEPQWIGSVREVIPAYKDVGRLYGEIFTAVGPHVAGAPMALWHDPEYKEQDVDAEAGVPLRGPMTAAGRVQVRELPTATMAAVVHHGAFQRLSEAYDATLKWVAANGYQVAGPIRELYLHCPAPVRQDDESYVTEIQVPVEKP